MPRTKSSKTVSKPAPKKKFKPVKKSGVEKIKAKPAVEKKEKPTGNYALLRGMRDLLPTQEKYWLKCSCAAEKLAKFFLFKKIETPILEEAKLFIRSVGKGTDIVEKEMYLFDDKDGSKVCLRPEMTASVSRAYIEHGMWNNPQPTKMWYFAPMFRHDRPQAGRYRQFWQFGAENFGAADPSNDAELILLAYNFFQELGLPTEVRVNSIGNPEERERYKQDLITYLRTKRGYLCEDCKQRMAKNPLRVLDCKSDSCQPVIADAPQIIDWLGEGSKNHFMSILEYLDELGVPYVLTPSLVRGLDYYNGLVFEIYTKEMPAPLENKDSENKDAEKGETRQSALAGGGRYDLLIETMGGKPTPAVGFSVGVDRAISALKKYLESQGKDVPDDKMEVYLAHLGPEARRVSLRIIDSLKDSKINIGYNFFKESLKSQLEFADKMGIRFVLIIGQKEVQDNTVIIRDMESGVQEIVDQKRIEKNLLKRLGKLEPKVEKIA